MPSLLLSTPCRISLAFLSFVPPLFGQFSYVANQGDNTVSGYTVNATTGALTPIPGSPFPAGSFPISVAVDPSDKFIYVVDNVDNNISGYTINAVSGVLAPIPGSPFAAGGAPYSMAVAKPNLGITFGCLTGRLKIEP